MPLEPGPFLVLLILGGVVALDGTSMGQLMISRPIVAAALGGLIAGDPAKGAMIGIILESFHLTVLPVGAAKYPEAGPAALVGGAGFAASDGTASVLLLAVLLVLGLEWVGGESVRLLRQLNVRLMHRGAYHELAPVALERRHYTAIFCDFWRGVLLVGVGLIALSALLPLLAVNWGLGEGVPTMVLSVAVAGLLASTFRSLGERRWMALAGVATGIVILWLG